MSKLRIALAQIDATVGDLRDNTKKIVKKISEARSAGARLILFPELAISGYPPEDLLLKPAFLAACRDHLDEIRKASSGLIAIVGFPEKSGDALFNAAAVLCEKKLMATYRKHHLPNYGVFDEQRYFTASHENKVFALEETRFGVSICEDIWKEDGPHQAQASSGGAKLLINLSSSPYHRGKPELRETVLSKRAQDHAAFIVYCNLVGGQDELVFDGGSLVIDPAGRILARGKQFAEDLILHDLTLEQLQRRKKTQSQSTRTIREIPLPLQIIHPSSTPLKRHLIKPLDDLNEVYHALVLGTRDYLTKNGFTKAVLGLSGGIDSALTACIAADAVGPDNVTGILLPSQFSSEHSKTDAALLAQNLDIKYFTLPIEAIYRVFEKSLRPIFAGTKSDVTEENLQSRIRGTLLMALSNKFGWLVLTTGNKSEVSVGYATLYGDMAGGFAVIKDVPKVLVYELAKHRNRRSPVIPENVFRKPPSAELRSDQKDIDSLPDYAILDPILDAYVEHNASIREIIAKGFAPEIVKKIVCMVDRAEYKRRQGPPGVKITERALGKDWRLPLTNHFTQEMQP